MRTKSIATRLRAWLELVRVPNLVTVPGDIVLGWMCSGASVTDIRDARRLALLILVSLLLYMAGLVMNDICDVGADRRERPERPLPSDRVSFRAAVSAAVVLFTAAAALSFLLGRNTAGAAILLAILIGLYDAAAKKVAVLGPLVMGLCRGANVILGASTASLSVLESADVLVPAGIVVAYIAAVTFIAARETTSAPKGLARWGPPLAVGAGALCVGLVEGFSWPLAGIALPLALGTSVSLRLRHDVSPVTVQRSVGALIGNLIFLQAALILECAPRSPVYAVGILALWPFGRVLRKWFYGS